MNTTQVAIYARVSSEQRTEAQTIASQVAALRERVTADGAVVPEAMQFLDDGYSGATLIRPALERLRDVVAAGSVDRLYIHSPDRLARKYAYQVLLVDEFRRAGVDVVFLNRALGQSPEDDLLLQVQGMIAEYERAKIIERHRRGKRHAARAGAVNVLSGAPYGYRYVSKYEGGGQARYDIIPDEARLVRQVFDWVGRDRLTIGEVCRRLTRAGEVTRTGKRVWDRSVVWGMLKHPAYMGTAAFGKTRQEPLHPRLRAQRGRPLQPRRAVSTVDVPQEEWYPIPVPAIVEPEVVVAVQEQLQENRRHARQSRRGALYLLQGLLQCQHCGYAYYGKRLSPSARKGKPRAYAYYRCLGTDAYRFGGERVCQNTQVRTDLLDVAVWQEVCTLLAHPERLAEEYRRRLQPETRAKRTSLATVDAQIGKLRQGVARLIDSYAEGLIDKDEFEPRITRLRQRLARLEEQRQAGADEAALQTELQLIIGRLEDFATKVHSGLETADWASQRDLIRTLVKRVEVARDQVNIVFRVDPYAGDPEPEKKSLQLCRRSNDTALRRAIFRRVEDGFVHVSCLQPFIEDGFIHRDMAQQPGMTDSVEAGFDVALQYPLRSSAIRQHYITLYQCIGTASFLPEPIRVRVGLCFGNGVQGLQIQRLHPSILHCRDTQRTFLPMRLRDIHASQRQGFIAFLLHLVYGHPLLFRVFPEDFIDSRSVLALVLCHSSHSKSLAAQRMGQQVLQGLHLVPLPGLHCLNDTRLQPTHMLIDLFPWNGMPVRGDVGSSTSRRFRRHLHRPLDRFLKFSRSSTPQRSQPAFASGDVATRIPPTTGGHSLPLTPIPAPPSGSLTAFLPSFREERYGLTTFRTVDQHGLGALCTPVVFAVHDRVRRRPCTHHVAFLAQACRHLWLVHFYDASKSSHVFTIPCIRPHLRLVLADTSFPRGSDASLVTVGVLSEGIRQRVTLLPYLVGYC
jgi:site-specific DNA recombinase